MDDREKRMQETPAYKKAMKKKESDSAVHKAQQRTFASMGEFLAEAGNRHKQTGFQKKLFEDTEELTKQCNDFLGYCMEHELVPSWSLLSVWLGCNPDTLYAIINLSDKRSEILKKTKIAIYTILEQFTSSAEGNPGGRIFMMKALWGLSDQQPIDVNVNFNGPKPTYEPEKIEDMIELSPDDYKEKA